jgi:hypothetical protein
MQQDVGGPVVRNHETIAFGDVKPFDAASYFNKVECRIIALASAGAQFILKRLFSSQLTNSPC